MRPGSTSVPAYKFLFPIPARAHSDCKSGLMTLYKPMACTEDEFNWIVQIHLTKNAKADQTKDQYKQNVWTETVWTETDDFCDDSLLTLFEFYHPEVWQSKEKTVEPPTTQAYRLHQLYRKINSSNNLQ